MMKHGKSLWIIGAIVVLSLIFVTSVALGQGGIGGQPPAYKLAFEATQQALYTAQANLPQAPKGTPQAPPASCPRKGQQLTGIFEARPGPFTKFDNMYNYASVYSNGINYAIYAGAPGKASQQGLLRVVQASNDPCADALAGKVSYDVKDYVTPKGPLTITQVDGNTVVFSIAGGGADQFNFVTGQFAHTTPVPTGIPVLPTSTATIPPPPPPLTPMPAPTRRPYP